MGTDQDTEYKYYQALHGVLGLYQATVQLRAFNIWGQSLRSKHVYLKVAKVERQSSYAETESLIDAFPKQSKECKILYLLVEKKKIQE